MVATIVVAAVAADPAIASAVFATIATGVVVDVIALGFAAVVVVIAAAVVVIAAAEGAIAAAVVAIPVVVIVAAVAHVASYAVDELAVVAFKGQLGGRS